MPLSSGDKLGPYEILGAIGAGGMGDVYKARDTRLDRIVAIKTSKEQFSARFEREARAVAALNHPHICQLYDVGPNYLVMEYVEGKPINQLIPHQGLPPATILALGAQMASGLAAAHAAGVVHRDIKPANAIVTGEGKLKILDFGLAKLTIAAGAAGQGETETIPMALTQEGATMGTVGYMSPEQVRGEDVDARSDLFSLGCVLYQMVSGKAPFSGKSANESLAAILRDEPPPLAKTVAPVLTSAIRRCLAKNPADRFQSARELEAALKEATDRVSVSRVSESQSPGLWSRRAIAGSAAALAAAGTGVWWFGRGSSTRFRSLVVLPLKNATGDPENDYLADGISENIINRLSQAQDQLKVTARSTAFRLRQQDLDPVAAGRQLRVSAVLTGTLSRQGSRLVVRVELIDAAEGTQIWGERYSRPLGEVQLFEEEIAASIAETLRLRLTQDQTAALRQRGTNSTEAYTLYQKGLFHWNKFDAGGFAKAIEYFNGALTRDPNYAEAYAGLAHTYAVQAADAFLPPAEIMPKAKTAAERALALNPRVPESHTALGIYYLFYEWDWPTAQHHFQNSLALDASNSNTLHFYGHYLEAVGSYEDAIATMKRAIEVDPLSLIVNAEYGWALYYARRYEESLQVARKTLELDRGFLLGTWLLASSLERLGRAGEAITELERVRSQGWLTILIELGAAYGAAGRTVDGRRLLAEIERTGKSEFVDSAVIAQSYAELHDADATFRCLESAYRERSAQLIFVKPEPKFDTVRSDPRFSQFLKRMNLV